MRRVLRYLKGVARLSLFAKLCKAFRFSPRSDLKTVYAARARAELNEFFLSGGVLEFSAPSRPRLSILLVVYNRAELTYWCLKSLLSHSEVSFELIVVDNASADDTEKLFQRTQNIRYIRNSENVQFLRAANQAAREARGEFLLFLNNDTEVPPGSIHAALELAASSQAIGAVGARLVLPTGELQEAGSIIWSDGTALGYGRGENPDAPPYMFRRDVDYCSGAFLLTPRPLFATLGGFDEAYAPAYYEEADYCARLWRQSRRVVYEPRAVVRHFEFASSASLARVLEEQQKRRITFQEKQWEFLSTRYTSSPKNVLRARSRAKRRLLIIDERLPHVRYGAGYPRANEMVRAALALGWEVTLYPFSFVEEGETWESVYSDIPSEVEVFAFSRRSIESFLRDRAQHYEATVISRPTVMRELRVLFKRRRQMFSARTIYDAEAIFAVREKLYADLAGKPLTPADLEKRIDQELSLAKGVTAISTVSEAEAEEFRRRGLSNVHVVSHAVVPEAPPPSVSRTDILFVGAIHDEGGPNADSVFWFLDKVFPLLVQKMPSCRVVIAGLNRSQRLLGIRDEHITVTGEQSDLRPYYRSARVFIAPTRFLAGIPLKVIEAAAHGIPVVASRQVTEVLGWRHGEEIFSACTPEDFCDAIIRLIRDDQLGERLSSSAMERVLSEYSRERFTSAFEHLLASSEEGAK
jgi:O-antigen biosynthesis protein